MSSLVYSVNQKSEITKKGWLIPVWFRLVGRPGLWFFRSSAMMSLLVKAHEVLKPGNLAQKYTKPVYFSCQVIHCTSRAERGLRWSLSLRSINTRCVQFCFIDQVIDSILSCPFRHLVIILEKQVINLRLNYLPVNLE